ncbi:MAG TPA: ABC transporter permease [Acidimicrobiales bacterium]|nr:ABC transporter permease [Acidimicrobiales bacterium]
MQVRNFLPQTIQLSHRSILGMVRQPQSWAPSLFFPLLLAAVYSSQFSKAVNLPDFPYPDISFLDFILPACVIQGVLFGSTNSATDLAGDIENSFMDRLLSSPVSRPSILVARLASAFVYGLFQATILITIFYIFGADLAGGVPSALALMFVTSLLSMAVGSFLIAVALRTGSQEVVNSLFPLIFVFIFISSAFFPVELMEGWYGAIAKWNPLTWVIDWTRGLTVEGFSWANFIKAVGIVTAIAVIGVTIAIGQLKKRLAAAS